MNPLIQLKTTPLLLITLALLCFGLLSTTQAVVPAPDGGYPGGNTAEGQNSLFSLTSGTFNTAVGFLSLKANTEGSFCTGVGAGTLFANTAQLNTAIGAGALLSNTTGFGSTANGAFALFNNTTGLANTASGVEALLNNTIGNNNTADGEAALENSTGDHNTAVGDSALRSLTAGSENTALGALAGINVTTADRVICIGNSGANVSNSCFIGQIRDVQTVNNDAIPVVIDSAGQLGTMSSSRRFKKEIKPMDKASETILALKPVTFHYKSDKRDTPQFGLIAEEVAEANPDLVVRNKDGEIYTVRYDAVNAMLLNEFLKEHKAFIEEQRKVREQEATIAQLKKDFGATIAQLTARLDEQASQIQKVSAQLEASKPAPRVVNNP
jgi:Chaperone of endosialidase